MNEFAGYIFIAVMTMQNPQLAAPNTFERIQLVDKVQSGADCEATRNGARAMVGKPDPADPSIIIRGIVGTCVPVTATQLANMVDTFRVLRRSR